MSVVLHNGQWVIIVLLLSLTFLTSGHDLPIHLYIFQLFMHCLPTIICVL